MDIKLLAEHIEKSVGLLLEEIDRDRKAIISNANRDAMIELRNARELSDEIIERANRYFEQKLKEAEQLESPAYDFNNK
jgi:hypothetical protein